mgnify:CR=1 FL=1
MVCARASTSVPRFASVGTRPGFPASCPNVRPVPASRAAEIAASSSSYSSSSEALSCMTSWRS